MALDDDAFSRALLMAGLGMIGQPNAWQGLARGGMFGVQGYDQALEQKRKNADDALAQQMKNLQLSQLQTQMAREQQRLAILGGAGQGQAQQPSVPSVVVGNDLASNPLYTPPKAAAIAPSGNDATSIARKLLAAGYTKDAEEYAKANSVVLGDDRYGKIDPKDYTAASLSKFQQTGNRADLVARDEVVADNLGGTLSYRTKYSTTPIGAATKTMSPAELDAKARGWAEFGLSKDKFNRGELHDFPTPGGGTGLGFVTPQGVSMVPGSGEKLPEVPAAIRMALATNNVTLSKIDQAVEGIDKYPQALGAKNYLGDPVRQRTDPQGVDVRAMVADIGSQKLHDRSGSAVTVSESPRLMPFIPTVTDNHETAKKKLGRLRNEYAQMQQELSLGKSIAQVSGQPTANAGVPSLAAIEAERMKRGVR